MEALISIRLETFLIDLTSIYLQDRCSIVASRNEKFCRRGNFLMEGKKGKGEREKGKSSSFIREKNCRIHQRDSLKLGKKEKRKKGRKEKHAPFQTFFPSVRFSFGETRGFE